MKQKQWKNGLENKFETRPELFDSFDQILPNVSAMLPDEFTLNAFSGNWKGSIFVTFSCPAKSIFRRNKFRLALYFSFSVGLFLKYKSLSTLHKSLWLDSKLTRVSHQKYSTEIGESKVEFCLWNDLIKHAFFVVISEEMSLADPKF